MSKFRMCVARCCCGNTGICPLPREETSYSDSFTSGTFDSGWTVDSGFQILSGTAYHDNVTGVKRISRPVSFDYGIETEISLEANCHFDPVSDLGNSYAHPSTIGVILYFTNTATASDSIRWFMAQPIPLASPHQINRHRVITSETDTFYPAMIPASGDLIKIVATYTGIVGSEHVFDVELISGSTSVATVTHKVTTANNMCTLYAALNATSGADSNNDNVAFDNYDFSVN